MFLASTISGLFKWRQFEPEVILLVLEQTRLKRSCPGVSGWDD
jgi:hypothetical protein